MQLIILDVIYIASLTCLQSLKECLFSSSTIGYTNNRATALAGCSLMSPVMSSPEDGIGIDKSDLKSIKKTTELPPPPKKPLSPYMRFSKGVSVPHHVTFHCFGISLHPFNMKGFKANDYDIMIMHSIHWFRNYILFTLSYNARHFKRCLRCSFHVLLLRFVFDNLCFYIIN